MRNALIVMIVCTIAGAVASPAEAARRLALVIGNGDYTVGPLDNPTNDASLMASTLEATGFEVTLLQDLGYRDLQRAVVRFGRDLAAAGEDTVGLVYYAGHAVQASGENYLIPTDADIQDELDLDIQSLQVSILMKSLERAGNRLNLVVLDACRNNPFKAMSRSGTRGLAKVDAPKGTLLAYSTSPGAVATDGSGRNSPYTKALARMIREPGVPVEQVFKKVRIAVMEATGNQQVPWESSSLTGEFVFQDRAPQPAAPAPAAAAPQADPRAAEIALWTSIATSEDPTLFESYLAAYPSGVFAALAQQRIASLQAARESSAAQAAADQRNSDARAFWETVKGSNDPSVLETLISRYPDTVYAELASGRLETLAAQRTPASAPAPAPEPDMAGLDRAYWASIQNSTNPEDYRNYLSQFPEGTFAAIAQNRIANGYAPQVAALASADKRETFDGDWEIAFEPIGGSMGAFGWCRPGERAEMDATIRKGKDSGYITSVFGARAIVKIEVDNNGILTIIAQTQESNPYKMVNVFEMRNGVPERVSLTPGQCDLGMTLTRVGS